MPSTYRVAIGLLHCDILVRCYAANQEDPAGGL